MAKFTVSEIRKGGLLGIAGAYDVELCDGLKRYSVFVLSGRVTSVTVRYPMAYSKYGHRGTAYATRRIEPGRTFDSVAKAALAAIDAATVPVV